MRLPALHVFQTHSQALPAIPLPYSRPEAMPLTWVSPAAESHPTALPGDGPFALPGTGEGEKPSPHTPWNSPFPILPARHVAQPLWGPAAFQTRPWKSTSKWYQVPATETLESRVQVDHSKDAVCTSSEEPSFVFICTFLTHNSTLLQNHE